MKYCICDFVYCTEEREDYIEPQQDYEAFEPEELPWPRSLRRALSDPITVDNRTGVSGRGTAEMKTNDVTGRIRYGHVGPDRTHPDIHTMCGHAMVPVALIDHVVDKVKQKKLTLRQAAIELTKPCVCGVFNPTRAEELLQRFL